MSGEGPALVPCLSCGAMVPEIDGPTHRYMRSSPGCWAAYGEVLAREYGSPQLMRSHQLTVDAYAVQHPGEASRAATRSVCLHLASLCAVFERGVEPWRATGVLTRLADSDLEWRWLEPPSDVGAVTVARVRDADGAEEHLEAVERWARSGWEAWAGHHPTVRGWLDAVG